jgi:hypothetical protein
VNNLLNKNMQVECLCLLHSRRYWRRRSISRLFLYLKTLLVHRLSLDREGREHSSHLATFHAPFLPYTHVLLSFYITDCFPLYYLCWLLTEHYVPPIRHFIKHLKSQVEEPFPFSPTKFPTLILSN